MAVDWSKKKSATQMAYEELQNQRELSEKQKLEDELDYLNMALRDIQAIMAEESEREVSGLNMEYRLDLLDSMFAMERLLKLSIIRLKQNLKRYV